MRYCGYRAGLVYSGIVFCILVFLAFVGCGGNSSKKTALSQSGIEGQWKMVSFGNQGFVPFSSHGSIDINISGEVSRGEINNIGVDQQKFVGGKLTVTEQGKVTGIIDTFLPDSNTSEKYFIHDGQMIFEKNIIVYVGNFPMNNRGIGILMKEGTGFSTSDMEGIWVFPVDGIFSVSIDINGTITSCSFLSNKGESGTCGGKFSITNEGNVSAHIETGSGKNIQVDLDGKMGSSKDSMILAGGISTRFEGTATLAVKRGVTSSSYNLQGNWKIFRTAKNTLYGTVNVDSSGRITRGEWTDIEAGSGTFTGGGLTVGANGGISGNITTSTGNTYTILDGQVIMTRDLVISLDKDNYGNSGAAVLVKIPQTE